MSKVTSLRKSYEDYMHMFVCIEKIGKQYIQLGVHNDIVTLLSTDGETSNVITLALHVLSSLITSGVCIYILFRCVVLTLGACTCKIHNLY